MELLLDINVNPRLNGLLDSIHSTLVAMPDDHGLVLLGRTPHGAAVAMASYVAWLLISLHKPAILRHLHRDQWPCPSACSTCGRYGQPESERRSIWAEWRNTHSYEAVWPAVVDPAHTPASSATMPSAAGAAASSSGLGPAQMGPASSSSVQFLAAGAAARQAMSRAGGAEEDEEEEDIHASSYWERRWGQTIAEADPDTWWKGGIGRSTMHGRRGQLKNGETGRVQLKEPLPGPHPPWLLTLTVPTVETYRPIGKEQMKAPSKAECLE